MTRPVILASASPRRAELLRKHGVSFVQMASHAEEPGSLRAEEAAMVNASVKAADISAAHPDAIVLAADTVIEFDGQIIGKPADASDAFRILSLLSGRTHLVTTGVRILAPALNADIQFADCSEVHFLPVNADQIQLYLSKVNVLDKAGAYALQEHPELLIESVSGDPENVIGLPFRAVEAVQNLLKYS